MKKNNHKTNHKIEHKTNHKTNHKIEHKTKHKDKYKKDGAKKAHILEGPISVSSKGTGFVTVDGYKKDIEIDARHLNTALHLDRVSIVLHSKSGESFKGEVVDIIKRAKNGFAGVLEKEGELYYLHPDDIKMYTDIFIPSKNLNRAKTGDKVFGKITFWKDSSKNPEGVIQKVLGKKGENEAEMQAISLEKGFAFDLSDKAINEARQINTSGIKKEDFKERKDFRKTLTFTIDPSDAKDFDDAISFKELEHGYYEVGVHIADVSHYVKEGSDLDNEAKERGTSVYLVDRTIPMLPEILSNDLCSLIPHADRLVMSAVFVLDKNAKIKSEWFGRAIIHSKKRFTYEEAEKSIKEPSLPYHKELSVLNKIAKKLTKERFEKGAISLEQEEVKFILDKDGTPLKVIKKERGDSNKLIEEFMLLANKRVAEKMSKSENGKGVFVYRIHDKPTEEKAEDLSIFLQSLGYKISLKNRVFSNKELNSILEDLAGKDEKDAVHKAIIRSMAKAVYSTRNIGHYGLAFNYYTHFTSPIRRYPDIVVHRMLLLFLQGKKINQERIKEYEEISRNSSIQEKLASDAERASVKYKQVEYMSKRIGKKYEGIISGIKEWGLYVEEKETKCEGLISVRSLNDDFYIFNEKKMELVGEKRKKRYRLGEKVKIKVKAVDLERKTIDYILA